MITSSGQGPSNPDHLVGVAGAGRGALWASGPPHAPVGTTSADRVAPSAPSPEAAYAIEVAKLTVAYGGTRAVHNLSMHVPHGSVYGLVGPSGAGKSTTLRVLATLQVPEQGSILIEGIDVLANPEAARDRIGYLPDFSGVYGGLTVLEYLDFYGALYHIPARRRRQVTEELLELIGLAGRRDHPVRSLSRGMKQKLGLARCLVHDPPILLLDEPASGLDPRSRLDLRDMLQELARLGKTIVISSHMLAEMAEVCSHLGVMRAGELITEGPVDDIISAVAPHSYLRVHLLDPGDADTARRLLEEYSACRSVEVVDASTLLARFDGIRKDQAAILGQLARSGVRVTEFAVERESLEDVFLQVTDMETAS